MEGLAGYIATGVVSLVVGLLLRNVEPRAKVVYWSPHSFFFEVPNPKVVLKTDSVTVQNTGRREAEDVEVVFKSRPDFFKLNPSISYSEEKNPDGEFIIKVPALGPKEFFTLQILSFATLPNIQNIRSKAGPAAFIQVQLQRQFSRLVLVLLGALMVVGFGFSIYWLVQAVAFISKSIGIV